MKILFLNPLLIHETWPVPADLKRVTSNCCGVTFPQLAAMVPNHECRIFDSFAERISLRDYVQMIAQFDVVAMSMVPPMLVLNMEIAVRMIRIVAKEVKIILGGHHATAFAEEWIEKGVDVVVRYEGEQTFKETIEALEGKRELSQVNGIAFNSGNGTVITPERESTISLDEFPFPRWELIDFEKYRWAFGNKLPASCIETSRGCFHSCNFCIVSWMWKKKQRYKSVERVMREFKMLYDRGVRSFAIADDNFGSNYIRDKKIFEEIVTSGMKIDIWMFCRADTILNYPDLLKYGVAAGVKQVTIGFEDLNLTKTATYGKQLLNVRGIDDYKKIYKILKSYDILVVGCFIQELSEKIAAKPDIRARYSEICDIDEHTHIIPLKDSPAYEKLQKQRLSGIDPFYAGIFTYNFSDRISIFFRNVQGVFNPNAFKIIFSGNKNQGWGRKRIIHFYWCILKSVFRINPKKIFVFLRCSNPFVSARRKHEILREEYLNENFLRRLSGGRAA